MRYYAGIGSRKTPDDILKIMHDTAKVLAATKEWTLRSGGAQGADTAFEVGAKDEGGPVEIYLPWKGFMNHESNLNPSNYPFTEEEKNFAGIMHPAWGKCGPSARLLHQRNVRQLIGLQSIHGDSVQVSAMVICWTDGGINLGDTGQAIRIANRLEIPVFDLGLCKTDLEMYNMISMIEALHESKD